MQRWEYLSFRPMVSTVACKVRLDAVMAEHGRNGWELVSVSHETVDGKQYALVYMKRPLQDKA